MFTVGVISLHFFLLGIGNFCHLHRLPVEESVYVCVSSMHDLCLFTLSCLQAPTSDQRSGGRGYASPHH